jgi:hypothetical protein
MEQPNSPFCYETIVSVYSYFKKHSKEIETKEDKCISIKIVSLISIVLLSKKRPIGLHVFYGGAL